MQRKKAIAKVRSKGKLKRTIRSVEHVGQKECCCISIDSISGLYLTNHCVVTHNTSLALHIASQCQKPEYGNKFVYIYNAESRLKGDMNLDGMKQLLQDENHLKIYESVEGKILSAEDYLKICGNAISNHPRSVHIIDSVAALCPAAELNGGIGTSTRGGGAQLFAQFCRQFGPAVMVNKCIVIAINQMMANTGRDAQYRPYIEKGGNALKYQVDVKMRCKNAKLWIEKEMTVGIKSTWVTECTALGNPPGIQAVTHFRFNHGIDQISELISFAIDVDIIKKTGSWFSCAFMQKYLSVLKCESWNDEAKKMCRAQGEAGLYQLLSSKPDWIKILKAEVKTLLVGGGGRKAVKVESPGDEQEDV